MRETYEGGRKRHMDGVVGKDKWGRKEERKDGARERGRGKDRGKRGMGVSCEKE
jgi:hypothetical protein